MSDKAPTKDAMARAQKVMETIHDYETPYSDYVEAIARAIDAAVEGERVWHELRMKLDAQRGRRVAEALHRIGDNTTDCNCEYDDENCCAKVKDYCCAFCIASVALRDDAAHYVKVREAPDTVVCCHGGEVESCSKKHRGLKCGAPAPDAPAGGEER